MKKGEATAAAPRGRRAEVVEAVEAEGGGVSDSEANRKRMQVVNPLLMSLPSSNQQTMTAAETRLLGQSERMAERSDRLSDGGPQSAARARVHHAVRDFTLSPTRATQERR